jgi:hypothetical protein
VNCVVVSDARGLDWMDFRRHVDPPH